MQCLHCQKSIVGKPWNHLTNILDVDEDGMKNLQINIFVVISVIVGLSECNVLPNNLWNHIVNKDYKGLISPVITQNKEFQYLTHREIQNMDEDERKNYYNERDEQIVLNPEYLEIQKELEMEDMRTEAIEEYSISSDNDDY